MELGSIDRVCSRLYSEGIMNPTTKTPPSHIGVRISAWKWALYNPEEARQMFIKHHGIYEDEDIEYWFKKLNRIALAFLTTRADRYKEWKKDFDEYKQTQMHLL